MLPRTLVHLKEFPLTRNGKIDRQQLMQAVLDLPVEKAEPSSDFERDILQIFQEVMENTSFGMQANFFDLGGNSLQAARILARLHEQFGIDLSFSEFYAFNSVREIAQALDGRRIWKRAMNWKSRPADRSSGFH